MATDKLVDFDHVTDYISREAAIKARGRSCDRDCAKCDFAIEGDSWCDGEVFVVDLLRIPAADVRPVVRGHYVGEYDGYADGNPVYDMWYCSECGCCFEDWDEKPTYNYCPNCGADMREPNLDTTKGEGRDESNG